MISLRSEMTREALQVIEYAGRQIGIDSYCIAG